MPPGFAGSFQLETRSAKQGLGSDHLSLQQKNLFLTKKPFLPKFVEDQLQKFPQQKYKNLARL